MRLSQPENTLKKPSLQSPPEKGGSRLHFSLKGGKPSGPQRRLFRATLSAWLTHPSELFASAVFLGFIVLALAALALGHPQGLKGLGYSFLFGFAWFLWMGYVVYFLPPSFKFLQFVRGFGPWAAVMMSYSLLRILIPVVNSTRNDQMFRDMELRIWGNG